MSSASTTWLSSTPSASVRSIGSALAKKSRSFCSTLSLVALLNLSTLCVLHPLMLCSSSISLPSSFHAPLPVILLRCSHHASAFLRRAAASGASCAGLAKKSRSFCSTLSLVAPLIVASCRFHMLKMPCASPISLASSAPAPLPVIWLRCAHHASAFSRRAAASNRGSPGSPSTSTSSTTVASTSTSISISLSARATPMHARSTNAG